MNTTLWWGKNKGKRARRKPRRRWQNYIKIDLKEIGRKKVVGVDWIHLAEDKEKVARCYGQCVIK